MGSRNYHSPISGTPDVRTAINTALGELDAGIDQIPTGQVAVIGESANDFANSATSAPTSNTWYARELANLEVDADSLVSIDSPQFVLKTGTYALVAMGYCRTNDHRLRLYNATEGEVVLQGMATREENAHLFAVFTANGSDEYELQHYTGSSGTPFGRDDNVSGDDEVYVQIAIVRVGS